MHVNYLNSRFKNCENWLRESSVTHKQIKQLRRSVSNHIETKTRWIHENNYHFNCCMNYSTNLHLFFCNRIFATTEFALHYFRFKNAKQNKIFASFWFIPKENVPNEAEKYAKENTCNYALWCKKVWKTVMHFYQNRLYLEMNNYYFPSVFLLYKSASWNFLSWSIFVVCALFCLKSNNLPRL